jgi:NADH:ubiquinone oxidoreductase subunit H
MRPFPSWHGPAITIPGLWDHPNLGAVDFAFSLVPAGVFFLLAFFALWGTVKMPKHPIFKIQTIGLGVFACALGFVGLVLLAPPVRDRIQDIFWFCAKVLVFIYLYVWYRGTFPRFRFDQLMKLGWKVMIPLGLGVLILTALVGVLV